MTAEHQQFSLAGAARSELVHLYYVIQTHVAQVCTCPRADVHYTISCTHATCAHMLLRISCAVEWLWKG